MRNQIAATACGLTLGTVLGLLLSSGTPAAHGQANIRGGGEAGMVEEELVWKTGAGASRRSLIQRVVVKIPKSYGHLASITGGDDQTLWFVDKDGNIRNLMLGPKLVKIEQTE